jgi:hypothetical protein
MSKSVRKLNRSEITVARVAQVIGLGHVLVAHNALDSEDTTVGTFHEAVDRGIRFACIGVKGRRHEEHTKRADDAAEVFVSRVGTTRANDAAKVAARKHRIELTV